MYYLLQNNYAYISEYYFLKNHHTLIQAGNQLGTPGGAKSFQEGPNFCELCPIFSNYVQHIFPGGKNF